MTKILMKEEESLKKSGPNKMHKTIVLQQKIRKITAFPFKGLPFLLSVERWGAGTDPSTIKDEKMSAFGLWKESSRTRVHVTPEAQSRGL